MTAKEIIECDRCEIETEFTRFEYDDFEYEGKTHKTKKPIYTCPNCGLEFVGDETLA